MAKKDQDKATAEKLAADEKAAGDKAAAEKLAADEKAAADKAAADAVKAAANKAADDKLAASIGKNTAPRRVEKSERRWIAVSSDVLHDGEAIKPGEAAPLTRIDFDQLKTVGIVKGEWDEGELVKS